MCKNFLREKIENLDNGNCIFLNGSIICWFSNSIEYEVEFSIIYYFLNYNH